LLTWGTGGGIGEHNLNSQQTAKWLTEKQEATERSPFLIPANKQVNYGEVGQ